MAARNQAFHAAPAEHPDVHLTSRDLLWASVDPCGPPLDLCGPPLDLCGPLLWLANVGLKMQGCQPGPQTTKSLLFGPSLAAPFGKSILLRCPC